MRNIWNRIWAANPYVVDGVIGALVAIAALGSLFRQNDSSRPTDPDVLAVVLVAVATGALTWRRQAPMRVLAVVTAATYVYFLRDYPEAINTALAIAVWTAARWTPKPRINIIANVGLPVVGLAYLKNDSPSSVGDAVGMVFMVVFTALLSYNLRLRREKRAEEDRAVRAIAGRDVADERLRIARELHDVVAHAMSIVAVQAGVAAHVIDTQPDEAKRMLENVRLTSHEALEEMRRLLGVLRGDAALAPAPGLHDLDALVESVRAAGIPVTLTVHGTPDAVPAGVDLTAYRIVQEALTNVVKHAGHASAVVHVRYAEGMVAVEVTDDGRGGAAAEGGHGLLGMRERVAVFGGELTAGPKDGRGFRVQATLPYGR